MKIFTDSDSCIKELIRLPIITFSVCKAGSISGWISHPHAGLQLDNLYFCQGYHQFPHLSSLKLHIYLPLFLLFYIY